LLQLEERASNLRRTELVTGEQVSMASSEYSHQDDIDLSANIDSSDATAASERAIKDSTKLCASNVEAVDENAAVVCSDNLEVTEESTTQEEMRCNTAQNLHKCLPDLAETELFSNEICETDADDDLEIKDGESQKVLSHDLDDRIELADSAAAAVDIEEMQHISMSTDNVSQQWDTFGTDLGDLPLIKSDAQLLALRETESTKILFDVEDHSKHPGHVPGPWPCSWNKEKCSVNDRSKVRMPYATDNWQKVTEVLNQLNSPLQSWKDVEDAIKRYQDYPEAVDFSGLEEYFCEKDAVDDDTVLSRTCLFALIPKIAKLATDLPTVCTCLIPLLQRQKNFTIVMSQKQAACLLANAFFCTYPPTASYSLAHLTFTGLFQKPHDGRSGSQHAKLDCIFNYFRRVITSMPTGIITFQRQVSSLVVSFSFHSYGS